MGTLALVLAGVLAAQELAEGPAERVKAFVEGLDRAFNSKDVMRLAEFYHPDVTIFEGGHVNKGWARLASQKIEIKAKVPRSCEADRKGTTR